MKPITRPLLLALLLLPACALTKARTYDLNNDRESTVELLAKDMCDRDVVFLGERHGNHYGHALQLETIQRIHRLKPEMVISMEMVERDQQQALDRYLTRRLTDVKNLQSGIRWIGIVEVDETHLAGIEVATGVRNRLVYQPEVGRIDAYVDQRLRSVVRDFQPVGAVDRAGNGAIVKSW